MSKVNHFVLHNKKGQNGLFYYLGNALVTAEQYIALVML